MDSWQLEVWIYGHLKKEHMLLGLGSGNRSIITQPLQTYHGEYGYTYLVQGAYYTPINGATILQGRKIV